jgi:DNA-binding NarL/FixJ family response regulator
MPHRKAGKARILIVDDHAVVREGLRELLSRESDLSVVGEAASADEAIAVCRSLQPDGAIVDLSLGRDTGFALLKSLRECSPRTALLVLSMHDERIFARRAIESGARGYVGKHEDAHTILRALRRVLSGKVYLPEDITDQLLASLSGGTSALGDGHAGARLSPRELEVLRLIGSGRKTGEIAGQLGISGKTVETHRSRIKEKLELESSTELMMVAINWLRDGFLERRQ